MFPKDLLDQRVTRCDILGMTKPQPKPTPNPLDDQTIQVLQGMKPFQRNDLGRFLGVTEATVRNWMVKKSGPPALMRDRLAKKLNAMKKEAKA